MKIWIHFCSYSSISAFSPHLASPSLIPFHFASLFIGFARLRPSVVLSDSIRSGPSSPPIFSSLLFFLSFSRPPTTSFEFPVSRFDLPHTEYLPTLLDPMQFSFSSSLGVGRQGVMSLVDESPSLLPTPHLHLPPLYTLTLTLYLYLISPSSILSGPALRNMNLSLLHLFAHCFGKDSLHARIIYFFFYRSNVLQFLFQIQIRHVVCWSLRCLRK